MKPLYVCTQTVDRHDCLATLVASCAASTRRPDGIVIVDHGYDENAVLDAALPPADGIPVRVITLEDPGCAHNGNWFIQHLPDDRVCCGDDLAFGPTMLERMAATAGDFVILDAANHVNPAACCLIRQRTIDAVGLFDERISPGYLYFDDTDYIRRLDLAGLTQTVAVGATAEHQGGGSQTYQAMIKRGAGWEEHCARFAIASANYSWRWGGPPFAETLTTPRPWPRPDGWPNGATRELAPRTKADVLRALGRQA